MADVLSFIAAETLKPFDWSVTDCVATVDRWVFLASGFSPLDRFGRRHADEAEARAWIAEYDGDFVRGMSEVLDGAGLERTATPQPGDIGLVRIGDQACTAILAGRFWFSRNETGLLWASKARTLRAWRLPCPER